MPRLCLPKIAIRPRRTLADTSTSRIRWPRPQAVKSRRGAGSTSRSSRSVGSALPTARPFRWPTRDERGRSTRAASRHGRQTPVAVRSMRRGIFSVVCTPANWTLAAFAPDAAALGQTVFRVDGAESAGSTTSWMPTWVDPSSPASARKITSRASGTFRRFRISITINDAVTGCPCRRACRARRCSRLRGTAPNGGWVHFAGSTLTTSVCPIKRSGRCGCRCPLRRATTFGRWPSQRERSRPECPRARAPASDSRPPARSLPGGSLVSKLQQRLKVRSVSASIAGQSGADRCDRRRHAASRTAQS